MIAAVSVSCADVLIRVVDYMGTNAALTRVLLMMMAIGYCGNNRSPYASSMDVSSAASRPDVSLT